MRRSFTDRVFGGICGGMAFALRRDSAWGLRVLFALLSLLSLGAVVLLYGLLWWLIPQESPVMGLRSNRPNALIPLAALLLAFALTGATWAALSGAAWREIYVPGLLVVVGGVFFLRQLRG